MANCPHCGTEISKPDRKLENSHFSIAVYTCDRCGLCFKTAD